MFSNKLIVLGLTALLTVSASSSVFASVSCEKVEHTKALATYIINDNLKYFNTIPGNKTVFSVAEIFENAPIETSRDLLDQIERSYKLSRSVSDLTAREAFWAVTINDLKINGLVTSPDKLDQPLVTGDCK